MRFHVHAMRLRAAFALSLAAAALTLTSCGGASTPPEEAKAPAPKPKNAAEIARAIVGAKVGVLVYVDRTRNHPVGAKVAALNVWQPVLEGTGIDPQRDLERAYVAAPSVRSGDKVVAVAEHALPPERVEAAIEAMIGRSRPPGEWLPDAGVKAARITVRGETRVVAAIEPSFLVILPEAHARDAKRFVGTGGFADPEGPEAAVAVAAEPSKTLRAPHAPRIPETIGSMRATVTLSPDGSADVASSGQSMSAEQAAADAAELESEVDKATSIKVAFVKLRVFGPVKFRAEGDLVKSDVHLTQDDIDKIFGLVAAFMPR